MPIKQTLGMSQKLKRKVNLDANSTFARTAALRHKVRCWRRAGYSCKDHSALQQDNTLNVAHELMPRDDDFFLVGSFQ